MSLKQLNLSSNPFEKLTPNSFRNNVPWAGLPKQKNMIENEFKKLSISDNRRLILNLGPLGGGKTFAARFFGSDAYSNSPFELISVYVKTPKDGKDSVKGFYRDVIENISLSKLREIISKRVSVLGEDNLRTLINDSIRNETFSNAILNLADNKHRAIMDSYLFGNATATNLKTLGLPRKPESTSDFIALLGAVIISITGGESNYRVAIWLDELEDLIYYTGKQFKQFSQSVRDLVDSVNERLIFFMNFTLAEGEDDTIRTLIGEALWTRVDTKVRFSNLSIDDAVEYCSDLIRFYQVEKSDLSPFSKESLNIILKTLSESVLVPREINRLMTSLLDYAEKMKFKSIGPDEVRKFVDQCDSLYS
jgi:hypothetical protein